MQVFLDYGNNDGQMSQLDLTPFDTINDVYEHINSQVKLENPDINIELFYEGTPIAPASEGFETIDIDELSLKTITVSKSVIGGKGGFGSQLRNAAARKKHFTNFDSAKDMNGRRLRDIRNEKQMMEWLKKERIKRQVVKEELQKFKEYEKENAAKDTFIQIDKSYGEKVKKWNKELDTSVRNGFKQRKLLKKRCHDEVMENDDDETAKRNETKKLLKKRFLSEKSDIDIYRLHQPTIDSKQETNQIDQDILVLDNPKGDEPDLELSSNILDKNIPKIEVEVQNDNINQEIDQKLGEQEIESDTKCLGLNLEEVSSLDEQIKQGPNLIKDELTRLGLKSGGRPEDRAQRLWDIKLNPALQFDPKYLAKKQKN